MTPQATKNLIAAINGVNAYTSGRNFQMPIISAEIAGFGDKYIIVEGVSRAQHRIFLVDFHEKEIGVVHEFIFEKVRGLQVENMIDLFESGLAMMGEI